jgi:hypothetical protein
MYDRVGCIVSNCYAQLPVISDDTSAKPSNLATPDVYLSLEAQEVCPKEDCIVRWTLPMGAGTVVLADQRKGPSLHL